MTAKLKQKITLTEAQKEALSIDQNIFVEAGAGSGKTTILVQRYIRILKEHRRLSPRNILALTFTEKAAGEMLNRIHHDIAKLPNIQAKDASFKTKILDELYLANVCTIHSFCMSLLKRFPLESGIDPQITICHNESLLHLQKEVVSSSLYALQNEDDPNLKTLLLSFSKTKVTRLLLTLFDQKNKFLDADTPVILEKVKALYEENIEVDEKNKLSSEDAYTLTLALLHIFSRCDASLEEIKEKRGHYDFQDLLRLSKKLVQNNPHVRNILRREIRFIMVDEFQDTDPLQWDIISSLTTADENNKTEPANLFLVGDLKQSIYSFRGAEAQLFQSIQNAFSKTQGGKMVNLQDNFRSEPHLIHFINSFFSQLFNKGAHPITYQQLQTQKTENTGEVCIQLFDKALSKEKRDKTEFDIEADFIVAWIQKQHEHCAYDEIAILTRRKKNMAALEDALSKYGIPCVIHSGSSDIKTPEVIELYNLIKGLHNREDNLAWIAVLKSSWFGISDDSIFSLYTQYPDIPFLEKVFDYANSENPGDEIPEIEKTILKKAASLIPHWFSQFYYQPLVRFLENLLDEEDHLFSLSMSENGDEKIKEVKGFMSQITAYEEEPLITRPELLDYIDTLINNGQSSSEDISIVPGAVQILSIHASKGLEFPYVILPEAGKRFNLSQNDAIIMSKDKELGLSYNPGQGRNQYRDHILNKIKPSLIDEEKRIFYVACTRAKKGLCIVGHHHLDPEKRQKTYHSFSDFLHHESDYDEEKNILSFQHINHQELLTFHMIKENTDKKMTTQTSLLETKPNIDIASAITPIITEKQQRPFHHITPISTTDIVRYLRCAKQYFYHDLLSKEKQRPYKTTHSNTTDNHTEKTSKKKHALTLGLMIHDCIEWFNTHSEDQLNSRLGQPVNELIEALKNKDRYLSVMTKVLNSQQNELGFKEALMDLYDAISPQLITYLQSSLYTMFQDAHLKKETQVIHEHPFKVKIGNCLIEGRFDSIYFDGESWCIVDYKTDNIEEDNIEIHAEKYHHQLGIYVLGLKTLLGLNQSHYKTILYFSRLGKTHAITWTDIALNTLHNKLSNLPKAIKNKTFTPPTKNTCLHCPHYDENFSCRTNPI